MNNDEMQEIAKALDDLFTAHEGHAWKQIGRCVYCHDCGTRLYQGRIPKSHTNVVSSRPKPTNPPATAEMRARWGKD